jgi:NitT/TauT family transport system permease protein
MGADTTGINVDQTQSADTIERMSRSREILSRFSATGFGRMISKNYEYILMPVVLLAVIGVWKSIIRIGDFPPFILPSPELIWSRFLLVLNDGSLWFHAKYTIWESILGFIAALIFGTVFGYLLAKSKPLEKLISPYIVATRGVPVIAIAPLLVIWFGVGLPSKVFVAFFIVFFPMLINTIVGIREVDSDQRELMRSYEASRWQVFSMLEVPSAMPVLLGGVKVGITASIMGAVVGEFVGADRGLGFVVSMSKGLFDTPLMFVSIITLGILSFVLYLLIWGLETVVLKGRRGHTSTE